MPTPDSWALFFELLALYLVTRNQNGWGMAAALFAIFVRPDAIILIGLLSIYTATRREWKLAAVGAIIGIVIFKMDLYFSKDYPWSTFFYHSIVANVTEPATFVSPLTLAGYADVYWRKALFALRENPFLLCALISGILGMFARYRRAGSHDVYFALLPISLTYITVHWFIIPNGLPRYLAAYYIAILVALLKNLADAFGEKNAIKEQIAEIPN